MLAFETPAFQQWMKDVVSMPAVRQVEAVSKKLQELNPGFDGKVTNRNSHGTPKIENGVVTDFRFVCDYVTDISPVRAFQQLRSLRCDPSNFDKMSSLSDLSPLEGMRLTYLSCFGNSVSDLSPLVGMPLTYLDCGHTSAWNLAPLKGMPLTELRCGGMIKLSDLSPLHGMPLTLLYCYGTMVSDLSPLKGMPLKVLYCYNTPVTDLSPLHGMNLTGASITPMNVTKGLNKPSLGA